MTIAQNKDINKAAISIYYFFPKMLIFHKQLSRALTKDIRVMNGGTEVFVMPKVI